MKQNKGKFIVLEGVDGAGTTSISTLIPVGFREEEGQKFYITGEPSVGPIGTLIRKYLKEIFPFPGNTAMLNLFIADREEHTNKIKHKLEEGYHVICDRYFWSTVAYQSINITKNVQDNVSSPAELHDRLIKDSNVLIPDITILLDVPHEVALQRRKDRGDTAEEVYEQELVQRRVQKTYLDLAKNAKNDYAYQQKHIYVVNATQKIGEVAIECVKHVKEIL